MKFIGEGKTGSRYDRFAFISVDAESIPTDNDFYDFIIGSKILHCIYPGMALRKGAGF